jgi:prepilin-type N-terminal cleavage/methylation domain-containing protein
MKTNDGRAASGFTLLELVVVLSILAIVTALATRELGQVQDQRRFDLSRQGLEELGCAVLGSPRDRMPDGTPIAAGFVSDMGRLPVAIGTSELSLAELWTDPGITFDLRPATTTHGVPADCEDAQVLVAGGWRGPYLHLPLGLSEFRDGWGHPYVSPMMTAETDPAGRDYARLRDENDQPIVRAGQPVRRVWHLGANGVRNAGDTGFNRDESIAFGDERFRAGLKGQVEVRHGDEPAAADPADQVRVVAFGPDPENACRVRAWSVQVPFASNPVVWEIPTTAGMTVGWRAVRAYFLDANGSGTSLFTKSEVRQLVLRPGQNPLHLTID